MTPDSPSPSWYEKPEKEHRFDCPAHPDNLGEDGNCRCQELDRDDVADAGDRAYKLAQEY